jgi:hypothetical protein
MGRACGTCIREEKPEGMKPFGRINLLASEFSI